MKTTNFEISKKLKEIGFNTPAEKCWAKIRLSKTQEFTLIPLTFDVFANCDEWFPSYDLETLLDALPNSIIRKYKSNKDGTIKEFEEKLLINKSEIWYRCYDIETSDEANEYSREYVYEQNISIYHYYDSLANLAGKMLIKLFEAGLIKFNK